MTELGGRTARIQSTGPSGSYKEQEPVAVPGQDRRQKLPSHRGWNTRRAGLSVPAWRLSNLSFFVIPPQKTVRNKKRAAMGIKPTAANSDHAFTSPRRFSQIFMSICRLIMLKKTIDEFLSGLSFLLRAIKISSWIKCDFIINPRGYTSFVVHTVIFTVSQPNNARCWCLRALFGGLSKITYRLKRRWKSNHLF